MNAFRKIRTLSLVLLIALVVVGLAAGSAQANGGKFCGTGYGYSSYGSSYCYPTYTNYGSYTNYCNYPSYNYNYCNFTPASYCYPQQNCFPVTVYDCYGRPTIVWQNSYGQTIYNASLPVKFGF